MKNFFKHPIVAGSITAFITLAITTPIVAYINSISFFKSLKVIWEWILNIFTIGIPLWIVILTIICIIVVTRLIRFSKPDYLNYRSDVIEGIKWEWRFNTYGGQLSFYSNTPVPICCGCEGFLILDNNGYNNLNLKCEHCSFEKKLSEWNYSDYQDKIKREIFRRIRTNNWKKEK